MDREDVQAFGCLGGILASLIAIPLLCGLLVEAGYESDVAQIESLRTDARLVAADVGEDVIGQVTQWNQTIAANQFWNGVPVAGFFVSDRWADLERIEVPR